MMREAAILLAAYSGMRLVEKFNAILKKNSDSKAQSADSKAQPADSKAQSAELDLEDNKTTVPAVKNNSDIQIRHQFVTNCASMGVSLLRQFVYSSPQIVMLNIGLYFYNSLPHLKEAEESLVNEKRISGQLLDIITVVVSISINQYFIASFLEMVFCISANINDRTMKKSKDKLANIFGQLPRDVWVLRNSVEVSVPLEEVQLNDIVVVNTGEVIPVDGVIIKGESTVDQHALTGESQPAEKSVNDKVFASTTVLTAQIHIRVEKTGKDTTVANIGQILDNTTGFKTMTQLKGEQWADKSALPQVGLTGLALMLVGRIGGIAILYSNFGYRIKLSTRLCTLNHLTLASYKGILIKDGRVFESMRGIDTVLFDKTGTLTQDQPEVGKIIIFGDYSPDDILAYAGAAECKLAHPIAKAIVQQAISSNVSLPDIDDASYQIGYGIRVVIKNKVIKVGSSRFMTTEGIVIQEIIKKAMDDIHAQGGSLVMVAINDKIEGAIELQPTLRPEIKTIISGLRQRGIKHMAIVSGDHKHPTRKFAAELGMDDYYYETLPEDKAKIVEKLQQEGRSVCFIGDGVNDAVAMKKATVSISLRGATCIATDLAQVVFMDGTLSCLCDLFDLANDMNYEMKKNLIVSIIPIPAIIAGVFFFHFGMFPVILLNQLGFWGGIGTAMLPLKNINTDRSDAEDSDCKITAKS